VIDELSQDGAEAPRASQVAVIDEPKVAFDDLELASARFLGAR
jgi:hypothetical protein